MARKSSNKKPTDRFNDLKPVPGEERYAEFDDDFQSWAVFGTESGFCYGLHADPETAESACK